MKHRNGQPDAPSSRRQGIAAGAIILAMALSVRFPITSVSPLLSDVGEHYGLTQSGLAALSAIPVLLFGGTIFVGATIALIGILASRSFAGHSRSTADPGQASTRPPLVRARPREPHLRCPCSRSSVNIRPLRWQAGPFRY